MLAGVSEVVRPVDRVVVVGAGIAGLTTASRLRRAGIPCLVLEARDRIGGRLHTVDLAGVPVDLGGSWIHHPIGNPLSSLCDEYGIARDPGDPMPSLTAYDRVERRRLDRAEVETFCRLAFDGFAEAVETLRDRLGPDATALDAIEAYVAERQFVGAVARRVRQGLRATEVVSVEVVADGIRVTCADGSVETGSHAVVTVPLGVLKRGRPRFDPSLPTPVRVAVDALGFGRYEKIALRFESAFWRHDRCSHLFTA
jgi:polyamine oxidase